MKLAKPILASAGAVVVMTAVSAWALTRLPDAPIPSHWATDGRPDRYASPALVLFIQPAVAAFLTLVFAVLPAIMPPRGDLSRSRQPYVASWLGAIALLLVVHLSIVASALGQPLDIVRICVVAVGLLLVVIGNYLPKTRFNYVMGIRTPWTLADETVWDRTHRLAGGLMMTAGLLTVAGGFLIHAQIFLVAVTAVPVVSAALAAVIYSALISPRVGDADDGR
jgi:uncharacterized membrane protein